MGLWAGTDAASSRQRPETWSDRRLAFPSSATTSSRGMLSQRGQAAVTGAPAGALSLAGRAWFGVGTSIRPSLTRHRKARRAVPSPARRASAASRVALVASCEARPPSEIGSAFISLRDASGATKRTTAHPVRAFAVSIRVVLTLVYLPLRFAQAGPRVGALPGVRTPNSAGRRALVGGQCLRAPERAC